MLTSLQRLEMLWNCNDIYYTFFKKIVIEMECNIKKFVQKKIWNVLELQ